MLSSGAEEWQGHEVSISYSQHVQHTVSSHTMTWSLVSMLSHAKKTNFASQTVKLSRHLNRWVRSSNCISTIKTAYVLVTTGF